MQELIEKIEWTDGYIRASPTNFGSVTAIFKRFMERLLEIIAKRLSNGTSRLIEVWSEAFKGNRI